MPLTIFAKGRLAHFPSNQASVSKEVFYSVQGRDYDKVCDPRHLSNRKVLQKQQKYQNETNFKYHLNYQCLISAFQTNALTYSMTFC